MKKDLIEKIWKDYQRFNPDAPDTYDAWAFGDSKEMADELAELVLEEKKTATSSNYTLYELEEEALPYTGQHNIILDGKDNPVAIVETTFVEIVPFHEVTEEHAYLEGEGDRSLNYWREVHEVFFTKELKAIERDFNPTTPVVCERFKLVYRR
jgi:uncharacterized protein YhfF